MEAAESPAGKDQRRGGVPSETEHLAHDDHVIPCQVLSVHAAVEATQRFAQTRWLRVRTPMRIDVKLLARSLRKMHREIHLLM